MKISNYSKSRQLFSVTSRNSHVIPLSIHCAIPSDLGDYLSSQSPSFSTLTFPCTAFRYCCYFVSFSSVSISSYFRFASISCAAFVHMNCSQTPGQIWVSCLERNNNNVVISNGTIDGYAFGDFPASHL